MTPQFQNRTDAGQQLAAKLAPAHANRSDVMVLALPRGGVPVAFEVATALKAPLDLCLVRKLGVPGHQELAMGAIALGGIRVINHEIVDSMSISDAAIEKVAAQEQRELERRNHLYRGDRPLPALQNQTVIVVDDGIATGATMRAAIAALRAQAPQHIVVAVPLAPPSVYRDLGTAADEVVCLLAPEALYSISLWYSDFSQTTDQEVRALLNKAKEISAIAS